MEGGSCIHEKPIVRVLVTYEKQTANLRRRSGDYDLRFALFLTRMCKVSCACGLMADGYGGTSSNHRSDHSGTWLVGATVDKRWQGVLPTPASD
ncbi:unnamed protein product [Echinostoma caproni]|uniref:Transposase n=1 Tax=Echinostoma caproni TaxID=27848 RepID=A0A183B248_9TREM|nr:unnamed protein product [Echinostoma caproni]